MSGAGDWHGCSPKDAPGPGLSQRSARAVGGPSTSWQPLEDEQDSIWQMTEGWKREQASITLQRRWKWRRWIRSRATRARETKEKKDRDEAEKKAKEEREKAEREAQEQEEKKKKDAEKREEAAITLQSAWSAWRMVRERQRFSKMKSFLQRARYVKLKAALKSFQMRWRYVRMMGAVKSFQQRARFLRMRAAAVIIQSRLRGFLQRRRYNRLRAALKVQTWWRMTKERTSFQSYKRSVITCQAAVRAYLARRHVEKVVVSRVMIIKLAFRVFLAMIRAQAEKDKKAEEEQRQRREEEEGLAEDERQQREAEEELRRAQEETSGTMGLSEGSSEMLRAHTGENELGASPPHHTTTPDK